MNIRRILNVGALALACVGVSAAASISYTTTTPFVSQTTEFSGPLTFQQFDPSFGTLISVELKLSSSLSSIVTVTNLAATPSSGTAKTELQVSLNDGGNNFLADLPQLDLITPNYSYSLAAGDSTTSGPLVKSGNSDITYTLAAILAEFSGVGNFSLNASTFTQTFLANTGGNTSAGQVTTASVTGQVIYEYTPPPSGTPEPASMVLMGSALVGLGFLRKRFKS